MATPATIPEDDEERDIFSGLSSAHDMWDIARSGNQLDRIEDWQKGKNRAVVTWVWNFLHVTPDLADVEWVMAHSRNPLSGLPPGMNKRPGIRDARVDWPITFMFHRCNGFFGEAPTWEKFWDWLRKDARADWIQPMIESAQHDRMSQTDGWNAIKFRAGTTWQSCVREAYTQAAFAQEGVWWKFHPLADIELKIDGWIGRHLLAVYVNNELFGGRKEQPEDIFGPTFTVHRMPIYKPGTPGVWVPDRFDIKRIAKLVTSNT